MHIDCGKETVYNLNLSLNPLEFQILKAITTHLSREDIKRIMEAERDKEFKYSNEVDEVYDIYKRFSEIRRTNIMVWGENNAIDSN